VIALFYGISLTIPTNLLYQAENAPVSFSEVYSKKKVPEAKEAGVPRSKGADSIYQHPLTFF